MKQSTIKSLGISMQPKPGAAAAAAPAGADAKMEDVAPGEAAVDAQQEAEDAAAGQFSSYFYPARVPHFRITDLSKLHTRFA